MGERFTFGIPLIARAASVDWPMVERLLALTIRSVLAQEDGDFRVLLAAHDEPASWRALAASDPRFELIRADWPPEPPSLANDDGGRKKWLIKDRVRAGGGGLLMFLDADDWIDRALVGVARASIGPGMAGGVIAHGWARDCETGRALPFPIGGFFDGRFHELCGSSVIGRVDPSSTDPFARDPHLALGQHGDWLRVAAGAGREVALLDLWGVYTVGPPDSHSERHGPFADWRRGVTERVRETGRILSAGEMKRFQSGCSQFRKDCDHLPAPFVSSGVETW